MLNRHYTHYGQIAAQMLDFEAVCCWKVRKSFSKADQQFRTGSKMWKRPASSSPFTRITSERPRDSCAISSTLFPGVASRRSGWSWALSSVHSSLNTAFRKALTEAVCS